MRTFLKSALAVAAIAAAASSAQANQILSYQQLGNVDTVQLVNNAGGYTFSSIGTPQVLVTATNTAGAFDFGRATFSLTATGNGFATSTPQGTGSLLTQDFTGGTVSFIAVDQFVIGSTIVNPNDVLLSFSFTGGFISVPIPGTTGDAQVTVPGDSLFNEFSSFVNFPPLSMQGFSISFTSTGFSQIAVPQNDDPIRIGDFTADSSGVFAAVPEPGTWAMMLAGFGLVGLARRRSNRTATVAA